MRPAWEGGSDQGAAHSVGERRSCGTERDLPDHTALVPGLGRVAPSSTPICHLPWAPRCGSRVLKVVKVSADSGYPATSDVACSISPLGVVCGLRGLGRFAALPKESVIAMLGVAMIATFAVDLSTSPQPVRRPAPSPSARRARPSPRRRPRPRLSRPPRPPPHRRPSPIRRPRPPPLWPPTRRSVTTAPAPSRSPSPSPRRGAAPHVADHSPSACTWARATRPAWRPRPGHRDPPHADAADYLPRNEGSGGVSNDSTASCDEPVAGARLHADPGRAHHPHRRQGNPQGTLARAPPVSTTRTS